MKISTFVKENVKLRLNIKLDVTLDLKENRNDAVNVYRDPNEDDFKRAQRKVMEGIRVGQDFIDSPKTQEDVQRSKKNQTSLPACKDRVCTALEVYLSRLVADYCEFAVEGVGDPPRDKVNETCSQINKAFRDSVFCAYSLGTMDGYEDGSSDLRKILGVNPSGSSWYPYTTLPEPEVVGSVGETYTPARRNACVQLPIYVQTKKEREEGFNGRMIMLRKELKSVETGITNILKYRLGRMLKYKKSKCISMSTFSVMEKQLRENIDSAISQAFGLGHFNGYEMGQESVKSLYYNKHVLDDKVYVLMRKEKFEESALVVDISQPSKCDCGFCASCIVGMLDNSEDIRNWRHELESVSGRLDSLARDLEDIHTEY